MNSFNTSQLQADTLTAVYNVTAPKHIVGTVELTQDGDNLSVIGVNSSIVNSDNVVASTSVSTPLLTSPSLFPMTVSNLQTVNLTSGNGSVGQVLALDASSNLVWADNYSSPQGLASVLNVSNDASGNSITNLLKLTPVSGAGTSGQYLTCDSSGNLDWITPAKPAPNTLQEVLNAGNNAVQQSILNVNGITSKSITLSTFAPVGEDGNDWQFYSNPSTLNLELTNTNGGYFTLTNTQVQSDSSMQLTRIVTTTNLTPYDVWVSPSGNNAEANIYPSFNNPFQTIQGAISYCEALTAVDNKYRYIHVLGGTYNENLVISKKVYIQGEAQTSQSASVGCSLNGDVSININANGSDMYNNQLTISSLLINGSVNNNSTNNAMLCLENCYIYAPNDTVGRALLHNPSSSDSRLKLWNCQLISSGSLGLYPLMDVGSKGQVVMSYCNLSAKGAQPVLRLNNTATCDNINNCKFENSFPNGASVQPIVSITADINGTYTFANCAFVYSSSSDKSSNSSACGISNQNTAGNNTIISLYNTFLLAGTNNSNYAIQDFNHATATQMICLYYMSGATPSNAFAIHANNNQNKFQLQIVS